MHIGILGGSFDPPHLGHQLIASQVLTLTPMQEVWFMPVSIHPFKKRLSEKIYRFEMLHLITEQNQRVSDFEIKNGGISYTIETLTALQQENPDDSFYWIIGSDQLAKFQEWKGWQDIIKKHGLIIFPRNISSVTLLKLTKKYLNLKDTLPNIYIIDSSDFVSIQLSSTIIRNKVRLNQPITHLVDPKVASYIRDRKLYQ